MTRVPCAEVRGARVEVRPDGIDVRTDALAPRLLSGGPGRARVALVGARALLLAGDEVRLDVVVHAGCVLDLVEVAATVAYDARGGAASWRVAVELGAGARLHWAGEPFVVCGGADVVRTLDVDLDDGAVALVRETVVLGRTGETGGALLNRTRVRRQGRPLLVEDLDLRDVRVRSSPAVLGPARCVDTVTLLGARADEEGVLQLEGPGSVARALTVDAHTSPLRGTSARWWSSLARR